MEMGAAWDSWEGFNVPMSILNGVQSAGGLPSGTTRLVRVLDLSSIFMWQASNFGVATKLQKQSEKVNI